MDPADFTLLCSPAGQVALAEAMELAPDEASFLSCHNRLSKRFGPDLARAALETALLRRRATVKFRLAEQMYFTREALEQASGEPVSHHRARRFAGLGPVGDLCCGIGGDAIALAGVAPVVAVDLDPLRLRMAERNLELYGLAGGVRFIEGDVLRIDLSELAAAFVDPGRRVDGRRVLSIDNCQPPLLALRAGFGHDFPLGVKLAPGIPSRELERLDGEVEFVSLEGELKECVLWAGPFRQVARRATLLPGEHTLSANALATWPPPRPPRAWLYDPDPAVVRAGLVGELAGRLDAHPLDPHIACLTGDTRQDTPFARVYAIEAALPYHLRRLRDYLQQHHIGRVQVRRRGSAVEPAELERRLKLSGGDFRTLLLTPVLGRPYVLVLTS